MAALDFLTDGARPVGRRRDDLNDLSHVRAQSGAHCLCPAPKEGARQGAVRPHGLGLGRVSRLSSVELVVIEDEVILDMGIPFAAALLEPRF